MTKAIWQDTVIADSDDTIVVEGNHYFPAASVRQDLLEPSDHTSVCSWKGTAQYYHIRVGDARNDNAAWYYPQCSDRARQIEGYVAFWRGVEVR